MKKYYSEIAEVMYKEALSDFEDGIISEIELRELEKDCFIDEEETAQEKPLVMEQERA